MLPSGHQGLWLWMGNRETLRVVMSLDGRHRTLDIHRHLRDRQSRKGWYPFSPVQRMDGHHGKLHPVAEVHRAPIVGNGHSKG